MWYARDVRDKVIAALGATSSGALASMIGTINTERTSSTPIPKHITYGESNGQYPEVFVDLGNSEIKSARGDDVTTMREDFSLVVGAIVKGNTVETVKDDAENYIEAILRVLQDAHDYNTSKENYWIVASGAARQDLGGERGGRFIGIAVNFNVSRNQL